MKKSIYSGDANVYFGNAESFGLANYSNGGSEPPRVNDIFCYDDGSQGHVAIITCVTLVSENRYRIDLVEQNWSETGAVSVYMDYDPVSETYDVEDRGSYTVQGWLRIPYSCKLHAQNPASPKLVHAGETYTFVVSYENTSAPWRLILSQPLHFMPALMGAVSSSMNLATYAKAILMVIATWMGVTLPCLPPTSDERTVLTIVKATLMVMAM